MAHKLLINYTAKQEALKKASTDVEYALKSISGIFKDFHEDYLDLLNDHRKLITTLQDLEDNNVTRKSCHEERSVGEKRQRDGKIKPPSVETLDSARINDFSASEIDNKELETPGYVENTQLPTNVETLKSKKEQLERRKKLQHSLFGRSNNSNLENKVPKNKSNTVSQASKQTNNLKQVKIDKVNVKMNVSATGRVSQQTKLVLQPLNSKVDLSTQENCQNDQELNCEDFGIDLTLFEQPFTQERNIVAENTQRPFAEQETNDATIKDDTVEAKSLQRIKDWMRRKKSPIAGTSHEQAVTLKITDDNVSNQSCLSATLTKSNKKVTTKIDKNKLLKTPRRTVNTQTGPNKKVENQIKSTVNTPNRTSTGRSALTSTMSPVLANISSPFISAEANTSQRPVVVNTSKIDEPIVIGNDTQDTTSDETYFAADDTYYPAGEQLVAKNEVTTKENSCIFKRNSMQAGPSNTQEVTTVNQELDIGNLSDWETDISCDKWPTPPPRKKVLMSSFDVIPERKKSPKYLGKGPVVRSKAERAKLPGHSCDDCVEYWKGLGLADEEIALKINECSKHRKRSNELYHTPDGFWDYKFRDTVSSSQETD